MIGEPLNTATELPPEFYLPLGSMRKGDTVRSKTGGPTGTITGVSIRGNLYVRWKGRPGEWVVYKKDVKLVKKGPLWAEKASDEKKGPPTTIKAEGPLNRRRGRP